MTSKNGSYYNRVIQKNVEKVKPFLFSLFNTRGVQAGLKSIVSARQIRQYRHDDEIMKEGYRWYLLRRNFNKANKKTVYFLLSNLCGIPQNTIPSLFKNFAEAKGFLRKLITLSNKKTLQNKHGEITQRYELSIFQATFLVRDAFMSLSDRHDLFDSLTRFAVKRDGKRSRSPIAGDYVWDRGFADISIAPQYRDAFDFISMYADKIDMNILDLSFIEHFDEVFISYDGSYEASEKPFVSVIVAFVKDIKNG